MRLLVGSLDGKSYLTKQKDGYSLPTNNHIIWVWMNKKIGLKKLKEEESLPFGPSCAPNFL